MVARTLDKLLFGFALLLALQAPVFVAQYHQYLEGYFDKSSQMVEQWRALASRNNYESIEAMISHHAQNEVASVRDDAQLKQQTLDEHKEIEQALSTFRTGNLVQKIAFIVTPKHSDLLIKVAKNYQPGVPLTLDGLVFAFVAGLLLNLICVSPVYGTLWLIRKKKPQPKAQTTPQKHRVAPTLSK